MQINRARRTHPRWIIRTRAKIRLGMTLDFHMKGDTLHAIAQTVNSSCPASASAAVPTAVPPICRIHRRIKSDRACSQHLAGGSDAVVRSNQSSAVVVSVVVSVLGNHQQIGLSRGNSPYRLLEACAASEPHPLTRA